MRALELAKEIMLLVEQYGDVEVKVDDFEEISGMDTTYYNEEENCIVLV